MLDKLSSATAVATKAASSSGSGSEITSALDSDGSDWFGELARPLLGKEPGVALHYIVGDDFPISTCAKYVAKTEASRRQPPGWLIRELVRSKQGEPFFRAIMDGCTAEWWLDFQRHERMGRAAERER